MPIHVHRPWPVTGLASWSMCLAGISRHLIYRDFDTMLKDEALDAVLIATPSRQHAPMVTTALERDLHVFCEKPFCLDWADSERPTAQLSVNWSDESHRKMTTRITMIGTNGRIFADRQECQVYLRTPDPALPGYDAGWTVKYTTELTEDAWFYLRGEEYSAQLDDFITAVADGKGRAVENDFASATATDRTMAMVVENAATGMPVGTPPVAIRPAPARKRGWFTKGA